LPYQSPHHDGLPAVLVRLDAVSTADLAVSLAEGHRCQADPARTPRHARRA
jgi:hypothetical protein